MLGRLGSETAATEARTARPNVQIPGNHVSDGVAVARQDAGELTARDNGMDMYEGSTMTVNELIATINFFEKRHEGKDEEQMDCIMAVLGADPKSFKREKMRTVRGLVSEIYSPPRVTDMLRHMGNHNLTP